MTEVEVDTTSIWSHQTIQTTNSAQIMKTESNGAKQIDPMVDSFLKAIDVHEHDWVSCIISDKVSVWRKSDPVTGVWKIKMIGVINAPSEIVQKVLFEHELRKAWDKVIDEIIVLEEATDSSVLYISTQAPFGISNRDFVHRRVKKMTKKGPVILDVSVESEKRPPSPKYIRAHTFFSAGLFETLENGSTKYSMISQVDIKGWLPKMVVNLVTTKATSQWFSDLEEAASLWLKTGSVQKEPKRKKSIGSKSGFGGTTTIHSS